MPAKLDVGAVASAECAVRSWKYAPGPGVSGDVSAASGSDARGVRGDALPKMTPGAR